MLNQFLSLIYFRHGFATGIHNKGIPEESNVHACITWELGHFHDGHGFCGFQGIFG